MPEDPITTLGNGLEFETKCIVVEREGITEPLQNLRDISVAQNKQMGDFSLRGIRHFEPTLIPEITEKVFPPPRMMLPKIATSGTSMLCFAALKPTAAIVSSHTLSSINQRHMSVDKGKTERRHSIRDQCAELLPRMMRVQISLPLPT